MKKQLLTVAASLLMSGAAFAQFTATQIWSLNLRTDPMPHNSINFSFFDMAVTYSNTGVPLTGMSSNQPGLPLPKFRITSTVNGNSVVCISSQQEDTDPWVDQERATFMNNGTVDTSIVIEQSNDGVTYEFDSKIVRMNGQNANEYEFASYSWIAEAWALESKTKFYLQSGKIDSASVYDFTTPTDSIFTGYTKFYYSNGLDSVIDASLDTATNNFVVENRVIVESKENGKTKSFGLYSLDNGEWEKVATFTYKNGPTSKINNSLTNFTNYQVYPNPAKNQVNISIPNNTYQTKVTITDLTGKVLINKISETSTNLNINTELLNKGVYVIFIENNGVVTQKKLVIE